MISRYNVFLNNIALSDIHDDLYVADIQYQGGEISNTLAALANRPGALVTRRYTEKTSVTVYFDLYVYNPADRQEAMKDIIAWAKGGGVLETSDRPLQRLRVICEAYPTITSALKYTERLSVTFAAYTLPYWEEKIPTTLTVADNNAHTLHVPGNVDEAAALVDVTLTMTGSASTLKVQAGDNEITLSGLSLSANDVVRFYHDENLFLHIVKGTASLLDKRSGADDLAVPCGAASTVKITGSASALFSVRGLWR